MLPGTYNCLSLVGGSYNGGFDTPAFNIAGGTSASPTVIQSTTPRGAVLDAGANSSNNSPGQPLIGTIGPTAGSGHITLDGFEIKNCYNRSVSLGQETGASFSGTRLLGIVVQNCYIHAQTNMLSGANSTAITIYSSDGAIVQNNYITNLSDTTNRACGIECWTCINSIVQYNTVIGTSTQQHGGIQFKNANQYNNTIRYNYVNLPFADASGGATTAIGGDSDGSSATTFAIYNNVVIADQICSASIMNTGAFPASVNRQLWYNNTFVGIPNFLVGGWSRFGAPGTIKFYNNIVSRGTVGGRGDVDTSASAPALIDYNCYPASPSLGLSADDTTSYPSSLKSSLSSWAAILPSAAVGKDGHSLAANPLFAATGSDAARYKLQAGSPCIGTGSTTGMSGGTATDMGAWGNGATQVGANFTAGSQAPPAPIPDAPKLTVS